VRLAPILAPPRVHPPPLGVQYLQTTEHATPAHPQRSISSGLARTVPDGEPASVRSMATVPTRRHSRSRGDYHTLDWEEQEGWRSTEHGRDGRCCVERTVGAHRSAGGHTGSRTSSFTLCEVDSFQPISPRSSRINNSALPFNSTVGLTGWNPLLPERLGSRRDAALVVRVEVEVV
jgi:hypothetical protein